ncbi:MAG: hypothetical protein ND807_02235 [Vicinamibacterales bacterium]|nr:hypothetical protein [Vicinamibacterales bacterium]
MRWTTQVIIVTLGVTMAPAVGTAQEGRQQRRITAQHDSLSNADFSTTMDANGSAQFTVKAGDFLLEKALDSSGTFTLRITQGRDRVTIVRDQAGYLVGRGKRTVRLDPRGEDQQAAHDAVRGLLLGSPAVRSFRRLGLVLESRDEAEAESPVMLSTLIDGGLVQMLDGDPGAVPRVANRTVRKHRAQLRSVRRLPDNMFKDCVGLYETSLLDAWSQYTQCMDWAQNVHWWFSDWAEDLCHWEWISRAQAYLWQFVSCLALPI